MRSALLTLLLALVLLAGAPRHVAWADNFGAGFQDLKLTDPAQGGPMRAVVFYPTRGDSGPTQVGALPACSGNPRSGHLQRPARRDRATVHARLNAEMIEFLRRTLTPK